MNWANKCTLGDKIQSPKLLNKSLCFDLPDLLHFCAAIVVYNTYFANNKYLNSCHSEINTVLVSSLR